MPLIKLTSNDDSNDIYFESDHISAVHKPGTGDYSMLYMLSGSVFRVKEAEYAIIAAIDDATDDDCAGCQFDPDAVFELTPLGEECLGAAGKLYPVAQSPAKLLELVDEAQSDAKVADERTRWFKKLAEKRLAAIEKLAHDRKLQAVTIEDATGRISGLKQRVDAMAVELEEWRAGKRSRLENQHGYVAGEKIPRPNKWSSTYNDFNRE